MEVPLAGFFLSKLLGRSSSSAEIHHLDSLDPELCRNLLSLKTYQGDVQDLGLDFTVLNSNLGQNTVCCDAVGLKLMFEWQVEISWAVRANQKHGIDELSLLIFCKTKS